MTTVMTLGRTSTTGATTEEMFSTGETELIVDTHRKAYPGSVTALAAYLRKQVFPAATILLKPVLYSWDVVNSRPGHLLWVGSEQEPTDFFGIWYYWDVSYVVQPWQKFGFGLVASNQGGTSGGVYVFRDNTEANARWAKTSSGAYASPLNPFGTGGSNATGKPCIYVTLAFDDKDGPVGEFTSPVRDDVSVAGPTVALTVNAEDWGAGVASVQFKDHLGTNIGSAITTPPYTTSWDSIPFDDDVPLTLSAVMTDNEGNTRTVYRRVWLANRSDVASPAGVMRQP